MYIRIYVCIVYRKCWFFLCEVWDSHKYFEEEWRVPVGK